MDGYLLAQQLVNGLVLGCVYGLIASGYSLVYGILGMINFAHGEVYMLSAYLTAICLALLGLLGVGWVPLLLLLTLILVMAWTALHVWVIERIAYRPLRRAPRLAPLISAIGVSLLLQEYARLSQGARPQSVPTLLPGEPLRLGSEAGFVQISQTQALIVVTTVLCVVALTVLFQRSQFGRSARAVQEDRLMASLLGIDVDRVIAQVFMLGAALAAIAGVLVSLNYGSFDFSIGFVTGVKAFTAAVLGGIGSLPGALLGGLLLGLAEALFSGFVNTDYKDVFAFAILILVLIFRPSGLLGKPAVEKV